MDHKTFLTQLPSKERRVLTEQSNTAGLRHLALYLLAEAILVTIIITEIPLWPLALPPLGLLHAFLFTLQHECTHNTPFRSNWLNSVLGHITGLVLVQPFWWFRYFHLAHHKYTNLEGKDPELIAISKPESWRELAWHLGTLSYWHAKIVTLFTNAFGNISADYVPKGAKTAIRTEARVMISLYVGVMIAVALGAPWILTLWVIPLLLGFPCLRLYLLAEHGHCRMVSNMFENSRTIYTSRLIRFLAWNMPYHCAHHIMPMVPFHKLSDLNQLMESHLKCTSDSYTDFTKSYVAEFHKSKNYRS